ncbi:MAG TPA: outer membrane beta-barrel protein [Gemmatimonadaceae bacterium]|nr:outer membrane beta-barrel protein [Gemmatimonadaceae bacterium]
MNALVWLASAASLVIPLALEAQQADTAMRRDTTSALAPVAITGSVTTSYVWSTHPVGDSVIVGRLYDRQYNGFSLNVVNLTLDRPAPTDRVGAGFHAEAWLGQNAEFVKSVGLNVGPDADIWQAYVMLNTPLNGKGNYLQLKAGKMATLMGVEVGEDVANPNVGVSYQDIFLEPFTETGAELDVKVDPRWDAELRVSNGWDQVTDVNQSKTVMGRLGLSPDDKTLIALTGYVGPEQVHNNANERAGANLVASRKLTSAATALLQLDYGQEDHAAADGTRAAWYAAGAWVTYDLAQTATLALRADDMNDQDGARTSGVLGFPINNGMTVGGLTATLNIRTWNHALLRPEIRFDRATLPVFDAHKDQFSAGMALSYLF